MSNGWGVLGLIRGHSPATLRGQNGTPFRSARLYFGPCDQTIRSWLGGQSELLSCPVLAPGTDARVRLPSEKTSRDLVAQGGKSALMARQELLENGQLLSLYAQSNPDFHCHSLCSESRCRSRFG